MKMNNKMKNRGVSPVIATVLLIVITIILGAIVFVWANGFFKESATKNGEPVANSCDLISFDAQYVPPMIEVNNKANVPIFGFQIKAVGSGNEDVQNNLDATLGLGESTKISVSVDPGVTEIILIPIILGKKGEANEPFVCPESTGQKVSVSG
jgi:flagellin-like protein